MSVGLDFYYGIQGRPAAPYPTLSPGVYEQHLFFVGLSGQLIHSWWDGFAGVTWQSAPLATNSPPGSDPIAIPIQTSAGNWELHVHVRGSDGSLQHLWYDGSVWSVDTVAGAPPVAPPPPDWRGGSSGRSLAGTSYPGSNGWQQHILFLSGGVLFDWFWDGSAWEGPFALPGPIAGPPAAVCLGPEIGSPLTVWYVGTDGSLHATSSDDGLNWSASGAIPGQPVGPPVALSPLVARFTSPDQTAVHYRALGADGSVELWRTYTTGAEALASPPGIVGDPVTTFSWLPALRERVFYMGADLNSLREVYFTYDADGNRTGFDFDELPGTPVRLLGLADFDDGPHVFFVAADGSLQQTWGDDGNWMNQTLPAYSPPTSYPPPPQTTGCNIPLVLSKRALDAVRAPAAARWWR